MAEETVNSFKDQMSAERKYYLGYSDTIPGTDISVDDAKKEHQDKQAEANKAMEERRIAYLKREQPQEGVVHTTIVTAGVTAEIEPKSQIEISEAEIAAIDAGLNDNTSVPETPSVLPPREKLLRESKENLFARLDGVRDIGDINDVTKDQIVDAILAEEGNIDV